MKHKQVLTVQEQNAEVYFYVGNDNGAGVRRTHEYTGRV